MLFFSAHWRLNHCNNDLKRYKIAKQFPWAKEELKLNVRTCLIRETKNYFETRPHKQFRENEATNTKIHNRNSTYSATRLWLQLSPILIINSWHLTSHGRTEQKWTKLCYIASISLPNSKSSPLHWQYCKRGNTPLPCFGRFKWQPPMPCAQSSPKLGYYKRQKGELVRYHLQTGNIQLFKYETEAGDFEKKTSEELSDMKHTCIPIRCRTMKPISQMRSSVQSQPWHQICLT